MYQVALNRKHEGVKAYIKILFNRILGNPSLQNKTMNNDPIGINSLTTKDCLLTSYYQWARFNKGSKCVIWTEFGHLSLKS